MRESHLFRRIGWFWACLLALALAACAQSSVGRTYTVPLERLQGMVAAKFPRQYPLAGMVALDLQTPRLRLLPEQNRMGVRMEVLASGPLLQRGYWGDFDVDFTLRYEPSDRTIRAARPHVNTLAMDGMRPDIAALLQAYGPQLAEQALGEVVLYQLRPQDLSLVDDLGLQPADMAVTAEGLQVRLEPKPALR